MAWMIVSDSSCEIRELENPAPGVQFALVPFKIRVGEREYVDLATLNTQQMLQAMTDYNGASTTACPSPEEWAEYFLQADNVFALTISSNLSGSYNAAMAAREMVLEEHPEKKIFVLDTLSCSGALAGAGAALYWLSGNTEFYWSTYQALPAVGFNGIPVALLALNNPIAVIFTGIFMAMLNIVGLQLTNLTAYNEYITDVIISVIVYLSAFSLAIRMMLSRKKKPHAHVEETAAPAADAAPPEEPAEEPTEPAEPAAAQTEEGGDQA